LSALVSVNHIEKSDFGLLALPGLFWAMTVPIYSLQKPES